MHGHAHHHGGGGATLAEGALRIALVGPPNSGKTTLFNALTGLSAKTGNYPGVTVAKFEGVAEVGGAQVVVEDLPGTYSLDAISPDEQVVADRLDPQTYTAGMTSPDAVLVMLDATVLRRSIGLLAQVLQLGLPTTAVLTFSDELRRRGGSVDVAALSRALGVPVVAVVAGTHGVDELRTLMARPQDWAAPPLAPPLDPVEAAAWSTSVVGSASYVMPHRDRRTEAVDNVLLHPVLGTLVFAVVMFSFFQIIFTVAAPLQDAVEAGFARVGEAVTAGIGNAWVASFLRDAVIGGVGGVLVFLPQIALLFVMVSFLESVGYLSRAAFLMDRLMAKAGLEGRAFVALLSSFACAIPGIMATRTLPSARDRIATMMAAPLMTCSARLPVYVLLIGLLVPADARVGPVGLQGLIMFALYVLGAVSAMTAAWAIQKITGRREPVLPFYMEIPPYRVPSARSVGLSVWESCRAFLRKVTTIILTTTIILWLLLNLPARSDAEMAAAGVDLGDPAAVSTYTLDNSMAAGIGRAMEPVFAPLGFDWRVNVGVLASLSAREVFVATMGQIASATDPENPASALGNMTVTEPDGSVRPLFDAPTTVALLLFFVYALQCMATVGALRRESNSWKWPAIAFTYLLVLAWVMAFAGRHLTLWLL